MTGILRGPRNFPAGSVPFGERVPMTLIVEGGLHMIRGNHAPYFSLTYTAHRQGHRNQCESGGAGHELILQLYPELQDLADLHLSDIDGVPMHAEANGFYWLAGATGGLGETYHGGNAQPIKTEQECLAIFARYLRIDMNEAYAIRSAVRRAYVTADEGDENKQARAELAAIIEPMYPRWKAEAEACIKAHNLTVYGDPWPASETPEEVRA